MHSPATRAQVIALLEVGMNDCAVSQETGVPRSTVREMRLIAEGRPRYQPAAPRSQGERCHRCWQATRRVRFKGGDYAALLGYYLGDGSISRHPRTARMRIALDARYPGIVDDATRLLGRCFPHNNVSLVAACHGRMYFVSMYSRHWRCILPQHGPGPKHERRIELETWQRRALEEHPWDFLRACINTDGCSFINRTGRYEYLSFGFANRSADIAELFRHACELVGVSCRMTHTVKRDLWQARINRRSDVALFEEHVGTKA